MRLAIGLTALMLAPTVVVGATPGFVELFRGSTEAYEARDYARMERLLRQALALRPAHPAATYNLAAAQALTGHGNQALDTLRGLARMGLSFDPAGDGDFAALREWDGFKDLGRRFARNRRPAGIAKTSFTVPAPAFIPEGLAYDDDTEDFFLGSVHQRRILRVREDGRQDDFSPAGATWAVLGLAVDGRRRLLWAATAAVPEMKDAQPDDLGRSALVAFDLASGAERLRHELPRDGARHVLGDVLVARDGTLYTTDSVGGLLYALDPETGRFEALTAPGALASPQGLTLAADRRTLYVADYTQGLFRFDLRRRELKRLDVAEDISVYGIDGLYRIDDDLVAVQNGVRPHRVVRFALDRGGRRVRHARVLASALPEFDEPTLGVVVGRRFHFVANSQWNKFGQDHRLPPSGQLRGPVVLEVSLERRRDEERREGRSRADPDQAQPPPVSLPPVNLPTPIR